MRLLFVIALCSLGTDDHDGYIVYIDYRTA